MNRSDQPTLSTTPEFTNRVMAAIALVPAPTPTRSFVASMRGRALRDALAALWVAWHLGTVRSWHVAPRVRARSFALVLAVASVLTTGSLAAAAAVHSVVPQRDDRNPVVAPGGSSLDEGPAGDGGLSTEHALPSDEPAGSEPPTPNVHRALTTRHATAPSDDGHHATSGKETDAEDDHHGGDGNASDDKDASDGSGDAHDGSDGSDRPAATDSHDGADEPSASNEPDGNATTDGGSSGGGDTPDGGSGPDVGSDGSGG